MPFISAAVMAGMAAVGSAAAAAGSVAVGAASAVGSVASGIGSAIAGIGGGGAAAGTAAAAETTKLTTGAFLAKVATSLGAAEAAGGMGAFATAALVSNVAATGVSGYGMYAQGQQMEANARANATLMRNQALEEERAALYEATRLARRGRRLRGTQRVLLAKARVLGGTPLLLQTETADEVQKDMSMILRGGQARAGFLRQKAGITLAGGRSAGRAGTIGTFGTLLSGASSTYLQYRQMRV